MKTVKCIFIIDLNHSNGGQEFLRCNVDNACHDFISDYNIKRNKDFTLQITTFTNIITNYYMQLMGKRENRIKYVMSIKQL